MSDVSVAMFSDCRTGPAAKSGRKRGQVWPKRGQVWPEYDPEGLARFLRMQHPEKTVEHIMASTGLPERTVRRWVCADPSAPNFMNFFRLVSVYGPPAAAAALRRCPLWIADAERLAEAAAIKSKIEEYEAAYRDLLEDC